MAFSITGQLTLQGPANIRQIVSNIRSQLSNIKATVDITVSPQAIQSLRNLNQALQNLTVSVKHLNQSAKSFSTSLTNVGGSTSSATKGVHELTTSMEKFGAQSALAIRRFAAWATVTSVIFPLVSGLKSGIVEAAKFERQMVKVAQTYGVNLSATEDLQRTIGNLSVSLGVSSSSLSDISKILAQAGIQGAELTKILSALAKTELSPSFEDIKSTTEGVIAMMHQFNISASDVEKQLSSISNVAARYAVESTDIIDAIRRTGGAFSAAGGNLNELIALFTSVRQTTRESAESIATGFRTIFTRIQRGSTIEYLKQLGVNLRDLQGNFVGPYEAVRRLSAALNSMPSTSPLFAAVIEELGGYRQVSKVIPLIQQFKTAEEALGVAMGGTNKLTEDAATAQQSLLIRVIQLKEQFLQLMRTLYNDPMFQIMAKGALELASALMKVVEQLKSFLPILLAIGSVKLIRGATQFMHGFIPNVKNPGKTYARGGLVPGFGDTDSVPAMLMPGEFVMKKSAVKALGRDKLAVMNMAAGGLVHSGRNFYGDPPFQYPLGWNSWTEEKRAQYQISLRKKSVAGTTGSQAYKKSGFELGSTAAPVVAGFFVQPETGKEKSDSIAYREIGALNIKQDQNAINFFKSKYPEAGPKSQIAVHIGKNFIDPKKAKDFDVRSTTVLTNVASDLSNSLLNQVGKKSFKDFKIGEDAIKSIKGNIFESALKNITEGNISDKAGFDFTQSELPRLRGIFGDMPTVRLADAKLTDNLGAIDKIKRNTFADKYFSQVSDKLVKKMASGGSISDTVPAMLTPGEFVLNREATSRIGLSNLHAMNSKGYAAGGLVTTTRHGYGRADLNTPNKKLLQQMSSIGAIADLQFMQSVVANSRQLNAMMGAYTQAFKSGKSAQDSLSAASAALGKAQQRQAQAHITATNRAANQPGMLSKANTFVQNKLGGTGTALAGMMIASMAGEGIQSAFGKNKTTVGIGSFASGVGAGAGIGSLAGPWGAAIGAMIGGIYGCISGLKEFEKELSDKKIEKAASNYASIQGRSEKGQISVKEMLSQSEAQQRIVEDEIKYGQQKVGPSNLDVQWSKATGSQEAGQRVAARMRDQDVDIATRTRDALKEGDQKLLEGFKKDFISGKNTEDYKQSDAFISAFMRQTMSPEKAAQLNRNWEGEGWKEAENSVMGAISKFEESLKTQRDAQKAIEGFESELLKSTIRMTEFSKSVSLVLDSLDIYSSAMDVAEGSLTGKVGFKVSNEAVTNVSAGSSDLKKFLTGLNQIPIGVKDKEMLYGMAQGEAALKSTAYTTKFGSAQTVNKFQEEFQKLIGGMGLEPEVQGYYRSKLDQKLEGKDKDSYILRPEEMTKMIQDMFSEGGKEAASAAKKLAEDFSSARQKMVDGMSRWIDLNSKYRDAQIRVIDSSIQAATAMGDIDVQLGKLGSSTVDYGTAETLTADRVKLLANAPEMTTQQALDPKYLGEQLQQAQQELFTAEKNRKEIENSPYGFTETVQERTQKVQEAQATQFMAQDKVNGFTKALEASTKSTFMLENAQKKFAEALKERESAMNVGKTYMTASRSEQSQMRRNAQMFADLSPGMTPEKFNQMSQVQRERYMKGSQIWGNIKREELGGLSAEQATGNLAVGVAGLMGGAFGQVAGGLQGKAEAAGEKAKGYLELQPEAAQALVDSFKPVLDEFRTQFLSSTTTFDTAVQVFKDAVAVIPSEMKSTVAVTVQGVPNDIKNAVEQKYNSPDNRNPDLPPGVMIG